ncbi:MAG: HD domain-containing protein [Candidatus Thermoplasmatota archaeon]
MNDQVKIVRDPIHGNIKVEDIFNELLETRELQRLYNIKQLGFAHLVFPGAHHTRLEHSLGTYNIAAQIVEILQLTYEEKQLVKCAALLHDIGHGPFSHTLESILIEKFNVDHVDLTEKLIRGAYDIFKKEEQQFIETTSVHQILTKYTIDLDALCSIIRGVFLKKPYLSQLLNSTIDVDQLDYLMRDAYYTGVAYGMIDVDRLQQTLLIFNDNLAVQRKGVNAVENILMARGLMYSSVYFHKTVRIAEIMLSKAIEFLEHVEPFSFFRMTDGEIIEWLKQQGRYQQEIVTRLKYRHLFKQAFMLPSTDHNQQHTDLIRNLEDSRKRHEKEREFEQKLGIPHGHVIIDIPLPELQRSEPRIQKTDIRIVDDTTVHTLDEFTPIAQAIRSRIAPDWKLMIVTDERYREKVSGHAEKILFS